MCFGGGGDSDPGARTQLAPVLPPNILMLSDAARSQLSGGGVGVSSLRSGALDKLKISQGGLRDRGLKGASSKQPGSRFNSLRDAFQGRRTFNGTGGGGLSNLSKIKPNKERISQRAVR